MMIIMKANATPQQVEAVIARVKAEGLSVHLSQGVEATIIGAIGETHNIPTEQFEVLDGVDTVKRITQPYKLASRQFHPENSIFPLDGFTVGGDEIVDRDDVESPAQQTLLDDRAEDQPADPAAVLELRDGEVPELVELEPLVLVSRKAVLDLLGGKELGDALRHDDDAVLLAFLLACEDHVDDAVDDRPHVEDRTREGLAGLGVEAVDEMHRPGLERAGAGREVVDRHDVEFLRQGKLTIDGFITHRFPLHRWREAIRTAMDKRSGSIKVVFDHRQTETESK